MAGTLDGAVALVTGGSNGLGRAVVRQLRSRGARVAVLDLMDTGAHDEDEGVLALTGDVADETAAERALAAATEVFGPVRILVNDAAHYPSGAIDAQPFDDWQRVFDVNVHGVFLACRAFVRQYRTQGLDWGRLVHISTGSAKSPRPGGAAYAASKAAVETMSATWAMELGPEGITSNVVAPGYIDVRGWSEAHPDRASDDLRAALTGAIPAGRAGLPDDIANGVAFFCEPAAAHVNGAVLPVDGGSGAGRFTLGRAS